MRRTRDTGFTLIEVLIAITVLSIGLLGLAALQISALKRGQQSYQRTLASALAYDIADRMRANRAVAISGSAYPSGYSVAIASLPTAVASTSCSPAATSTAPCTSAQLAAWDVSNWFVNGVKAELTGGLASISCAGSCGAGALETVTVMWDEFHTGASDTSCPAASAYDPNVNLACYSISFVP